MGVYFVYISMAASKLKLKKKTGSNKLVSVHKAKHEPTDLNESNRGSYEPIIFTGTDMVNLVKILPSRWPLG